MTGSGFWSRVSVSLGDDSAREGGMGSFKLLAHPWWVNLLLLVPLAAYFLFAARNLSSQAVSF
jgi:hypothetical protein